MAKIYRLKDYFFKFEDGTGEMPPGTALALVAENCPFEGRHTMVDPRDEVEIEVDAELLEFCPELS